MSEPQNDHDLGELAVRNNFLSQEELRACREAQKLSDPPRPLGQIFLEMQLLTQSQLDRLTQQPRKPQEHAAGLADLFGRLAVELGFCSQEKVEECLSEQRRLEAEGQKMRLGQIMLKRRHLTTEQFLEILKLQEKTVLTCPRCAAKYFAGDLGEPGNGNVFRCLACQTVLSLPPPPVPAKAPSKSPDHPESTAETIRLTPPPRPGKIERPPSEHGAPLRTFGRYQVYESVGTGPVGTVYRARDSVRQRKVALKEFHLKDADPEAGQRFLRDARVAAQLDHPGIVEIFEVGSNEEAPYFAMEFIEGMSLEKMMAAGRSARDEYVTLLEKALRALDYAHSQGIAHRNLKPTNILIDGRKEPHLSDFGLRDGVVPTASPEQLRGDAENVDARSDVYSAGVLLYEILAGRKPFEASGPEDLKRKILEGDPPRPRTIRPDLPRDLEVICLKAMDRDRALRYESGGEMADDVRRYLEGEVIVARPISAITRVGTRVRRHKLVTVLAVLGLLALVAGGYFGVRWVRDHRRNQAFLEAKRRRDQAQPHYDAAAKAYKETAEQLLQDREPLRDLQRNLRELGLRTDELQRAVSRTDAETAALFGKARDRFVQVQRSLAAATAEREETRAALEEGRRLYSDAGQRWQKPGPEAERLLRECNTRLDEAGRLRGKIKAWPGESRRSLEGAVASLSQALAEDGEFPEAWHLRAKTHLLLGRIDEAGRDFRDARAAYDRKIAAIQDRLGSGDEELRGKWTEQLEELRRKSVEHLYDFGRYLCGVCDLWRGRALILAGERGETISFARQETPAAARIREEMTRTFEAFLAAGKSGRLETALARAALYGAGVPIDPKPKLSELDQPLRDDQTDGTGKRALGMTYLLEKNYRKAYQELHASVSLATPLIETGELYGICLFPKPVLEWALAAHTAEIERDPSPELHLNRGVLYQALRRFEEAGRDFDSALRLRPNDPEARLRKIGLRLRVGEIGEVVPLLDSLAAAGGPTLAEALFDRASLLLAQGMAEEAFVDIEKALKESPESPVLLLLRARVNVARGSATSASDDLRKVIDALRTSATAYEARALVQIEGRNYLGAQEDAERALDLWPEYVSAYVTRARARSLRNESEGADRDLDQALRLDPKRTVAWVLKGDLRRNQVKPNLPADQMRKLLKAALDAYESALKMDAKCTDALVLRAVTRIDLGLSRDLDELTAIVQEHPRCALAYEWRGHLFYREEMDPQAIEEWKQARNLVPPGRRARYDDFIAEADRRYKEFQKRPEWYRGFRLAQRHIPNSSVSRSVRNAMYAEAKKHYQAAERKLPAEIPTDPEEVQWMVLGTYNYACVLAVEAESAKENRPQLLEDALKWLTLSVRCGYKGRQDRCHINTTEHLRTDEDLELLRSDPRFRKLVGYVEE